MRLQIDPVQSALLNAAELLENELEGRSPHSSPRTGGARAGGSYRRAADAHGIESE